MKLLLTKLDLGEPPQLRLSSQYPAHADLLCNSIDLASMNEILGSTPWNGRLTVAPAMPAPPPPPALPLPQRKTTRIKSARQRNTRPPSAATRTIHRLLMRPCKRRKSRRARAVTPDHATAPTAGRTAQPGRPSTMRKSRSISLA